jgi:hypothetical protein
VHLSDRRDDVLIPYARRNGLSYTLGELLRSMKENGIAKALLLSPPLKSGVPLPNEEVMALCQRSRGLLSPVFTVVPTARGVKEALSIARKAEGTVKGFKVLLGYVEVFAHDPVFDGLYDYAEEEGLPVMFHTGDTADSRGSLVHSHPLTLDALANARPGLKIVACHFGNPWIDDVGELLYKHENVYADVSGLTTGGSKYSLRHAEWLARKLSDAIYFAGGADKVVFGSDYPVTPQSTALALVAKLGIDEADKEKILSRNARRVFPL